MRRLLLAALLLLPAAAHAQAPAYIAPGTITWGFAATFPPFESMIDGKAGGFDIDLAEAISKKMGLPAKIDAFEFKGLIPALLGKRIDTIISGMYINPERTQVADFVAYAKVGDQIAVAQGNPLHINDQMSLCGHRVAAPVGTVFELAVNKISAACTAAGKPAIDKLALDGTASSGFALQQGRVDALIASTATIAAMMTSLPGAMQPTGEPFDNDTRLGIAYNKDNPGLGAAITKALSEVVADGTYKALLAKWKLPPSTSMF
jgi:polar amino acid transport system substrate-binding protein